MDWADVFRLAVAALIAVGAWFLKDLKGRVTDLEKRNLDLERERVTRADVDELRHSLTASIVNVGERLEARLERLDAKMVRRDDR